MSARGERTITVGSKEVTVLFTNRALVNAEKRLGKGIIAILNGFSGEGSSGINEISILLHTGMEAARLDQGARGKAVSMDDAYKVLDSIGFAAAAGPVLEAAAEVLAYSNGGESVDADADPND